MRHAQIVFELATPAFVSTADQNAAELGPQTIKGLLRWWWRALPENANLTVDKLKEEEASIFGFAAKEIRVRSNVAVTLKCERSTFRDQGQRPYASGLKVKSGKFEVDALEYLAYGPVATVSRKEKDNDGRAYNPKFNDEQTGRAKTGLLLKRPALEPGSRFVLGLSWRSGSLGKKQEQGLVRAVAAWLELGGIGSRSRKGWGSVCFRAREMPDELTKVFDEARRELRAMDTQPTAAVSPTPWPSLASFRLIGKVTGSDWKETLGRLGEKYKALKPSSRSAERWIAGSAAPRRAFSIILKVRPQESESQIIEGILGVFICNSSEKSKGQEEWNRFFQSLRWV